MKQLLFIVPLLFVLAGCREEQVNTGEELFTNLDMESGGTAPANWWESVPISGFEKSWTTEEASSPTRSLKTGSVNGSSTDFAFWAQTYSGTSFRGKDLTVTVKVKCKSVTGQGISIAIRGDSDSYPNGQAEQFVTTEGKTSIRGSFEWTTYTLTMNDVGAGISSVTVYLIFLPNTVGSAYFDDVSLVAR